MRRHRTLTLFALLASASLLGAGCRMNYDTSRADTGGSYADGDYDESTDDDERTDTGDTADDWCDDESPVTLYLSPDDSNSMSSPIQARLAVMDGWDSLSGVSIRTYEFMNYYDFDYEPAEEGELNVAAALVDDGKGRYTMQIGVSSEEVSNAERDPMNITFVLDTSGSMSGTPMSMLKETGRAIAGSLKEGDVVSMVVWDTSNAILLDSHEVTGADDPVLLAEIESLGAGGGTDLYGGLTAGYELASKNFSEDRINRIVLVSDGGANVGVTEKELIAWYAGGEQEHGIYMVGVGVGSSTSYNDDLMDAVTDQGKGASVFIGEEDEAWKIFGERFVNTMDVAARDVMVELDLPPGFEIQRFSGEEVSTEREEVKAQHIAPNDAMVFYQTLETCAPDLAEEDAAITITARYLDARTFAQHEVTLETTFGELLEADTALLEKGEAVYAYAESLKTWRDEYDPSAIGWALDEVAEAEKRNPEDPDLTEIRMVLETLEAM